MRPDIFKSHKWNMGLLILIIIMLLLPNISGDSSVSVDTSIPSNENLQLLDNYEVNKFPEKMLKVAPSTNDQYPEPSEINRDSFTINLFLEPSEIRINRINGWDFIDIDGYAYPDQPGMPSLPIKSVNVLLPADASDISIEVLNLGVMELPGEFKIPGVPEPQPIIEKGDNEDESEFNPEPEPLQPPILNNDFTLEYATEGYTRGFRIATYLYNPIHINARNNLEVITDFSFKLSYIPGILPANPLSERSIFRNILKDSVVNPQNLNNFAPKPLSKPTGPISAKDVKYVIITNSSLIGSGLQGLSDWKTKKGVPAEIVDIPWIITQYSGNDTQERIRNFLKDAMVTWGTEYCLLGGDTSVVPYRSCWAAVGIRTEPDIASDIYYSDLDLNFDADADRTYGEPLDNVDFHPDIIVGRAPVETVGEALDFVDKMLAYIKNPPGNYMINATFAGEFLDKSTNSSIGLDTIKDTIIPPRYFSTSLLDAGYQKYFNMSKADFRDTINRGSGIIFHSGHSNYNVMGMGSPLGGDYAWYNSDAIGLTNGYKMGVLYSLGCITTKFDQDDCIAEYHVRFGKDGAVAYIGNSRYGWYSPGSPGNGPSEKYMKQMATEIFTNNKVRVGDNFAAGKDAYVGWSGGNGSMRWLQFALNLIGEPEMFMWTDIPENLSVTHPTNGFSGIQTLPVQVNDSTGTHIKDALVCVQNKNNYKYGLTDINGSIDFQVNLSANDILNVTVTKHNYFPYEGNLTTTLKDLKPPVMTIDEAEYGWYNVDPGNVIYVSFDSDGETDLSRAEYSLSTTGPWVPIFDTPRPYLDTPWNITALWESLHDGFNKIVVRCNDSADPNHWVMGNITFKKDTTAPAITVNTPDYGWYTSDPGADFDVDFSNLSSGSSLAYADYSINSATGPWYNIFTSSIAQYTDDWPVKWSKLDDGPNTIYVRLFDEAGNEDQTSDTITIKRDVLPPIIVIRKSTYGWYSTDPGAVIDIDFSNGGNGSMLDYAQYKIGETGSWRDIFTDDTTDFIAKWGVDWSELQEGTNTIYMQCYDQVGWVNETSGNFIILKDTTAPQIIINNNKYGWYSSDPGNIIDVDFVDGNMDSSLLDRATYRVHSELNPGSPGPWRTIFNYDTSQYTDNWMIYWNDLDEGNNTIEVQVFDSATNKNVTIDTIYFYKDTLAPSITVNIEEYGWYNSDPGAVIDVDFSNNDMGSNLDYATYQVTGSPSRMWWINKANYTSNWAIKWSDLSEGENIVKVQVYDLAGHYAEDTIKIYKDTSKPEMIINQKEYGWYSEDPGAVIDVDFLNIVDTSVTEDKYCNLDFAEYKIGIEGEWVRIFDSDIKDYTEEWSVNWSVLDEGINEIYFRSCDISSNVNESNTPILFKKDTQAPNVNIIQNVYGWYNSNPGNIIDVDFLYLPMGTTESDLTKHSKLQRAQYLVEGIDIWVNIFNDKYKNYVTYWNISWSMLGEGKNIIHVRVFDEAGNVYYNPSSNITMLVDTQVPDAITNEYEYGWFKSNPGSIIDVDFTATSTSGISVLESPLKKAQYRIGPYGTWSNIFNLDNSAVDKYDNTDDWGIDWDSTQEGLNYIFIRVFDAAGNVYEPSDNIIIKRDTVGPDAPELFSPAEGISTTDQTPQFCWHEPNDPGSNTTIKYNIQISKTELFSDNVVDAEASWVTYLNTTDLDFGEYHWRVRGIDAAGNIGAWSSGWSFNIVSFGTKEANLPPVADAGTDIVVSVREVFKLDGSRSSDPENDKLKYFWYLDDDSQPDAVGVYVNWTYFVMNIYPVKLEVFDEAGGSDSDTVIVTVLDSEKDSDNDDIPDAWEEYYGLNPNDAEDAKGDLDNDGYVNSLEYTQGSSLSDAISTPANVRDNKPPNIEHYAIQYGRVFTAIEIEAKVTDDSSGVKEVTLYYKKKTDQAYNSITMGNENPYKATIPASIATLDDVEYFIEAVDNAKIPNVAYYARDGMVHKRPTQTNDIDINIQERYNAPEDDDMINEFLDRFSFGSFEVCFIVIVIIIVLIISFAFVFRNAVRAKQIKNLHQRRRTVYVTHGKNMTWEGFELEDISEDEDLNLIEDDFELDEI